MYMAVVADIEKQLVSDNSARASIQLAVYLYGRSLVSSTSQANSLCTNAPPDFILDLSNFKIVLKNIVKVNLFLQNCLFLTDCTVYFSINKDVFSSVNVVKLFSRGWPTCY